MLVIMATSIFLEAQFLPGDMEELRLPCQLIEVRDNLVTVHGVETRYLQRLNWVPDYLSFEADGQHLRYRVGRPAVKPPLRARFPRL